MSSLTIPRNVSSIGQSAFWEDNIVSISVETGNLVYDSRDNCNAIIETATNTLFIGSCNSIIPHSVTIIGECAFHSCKGLTAIEIPNSVTTIGAHAFYMCEGLTSIEIPNSVTTIGAGAFCWCCALTSIEIPNSVTTIGAGAFAACTNLTSVTLSNGLTSIGSGAFQLTKLTSITLPASLTKIGGRAFYNCGIRDMYCYAVKVPEADSTAFESMNSPWSTTLHVPRSSIDAYKATYPWNTLAIVMLNIPTHSLSYVIDGELYKSYELEEGAIITPEPAPIKEGYTFSGWSEIPETMPTHDVVVTGSFSVNRYKITYYVDEKVYKTYENEYGATIIPEETPIKEGYSFSGWSEIPQTMPAHDVTVTGSFSINKYKLTYMVNDEEYKSYEVIYGTSITAEKEPTKEGYTFSGWSDIPETMPAHDVTVTGTFYVNKYKLTYKIDGEVYKTYDVDYGAKIIPETEPVKEGYTFSGWSWIPSKMPAEDVTVTGTFSINSYKLTYMIDDKVYKETMYEYGATITPEPQPEGDYLTFEWSEIPQTMPAHDVVVYANYTSGIIEVLMASQQNARIYSPNGKKLNKLQKGLNIVILDDGTVKKIVIN